MRVLIFVFAISMCNVGSSHANDLTKFMASMPKYVLMPSEYGFKITPLNDYEESADFYVSKREKCNVVSFMLSSSLAAIQRGDIQSTKKFLTNYSYHDGNVIYKFLLEQDMTPAQLGEIIRETCYASL